jgi:preprotein translocase subunit Sec61beta
MAAPAPPGISYIYLILVPLSMAKKNEGGFASSAGLMRYFDTEDDRGLKINPRFVIAVAIAFTALILILPVLFPV